MEIYSTGDSPVISSSGIKSPFGGRASHTIPGSEDGFFIFPEYTPPPPMEGLCRSLPHTAAGCSNYLGDRGSPLQAHFTHLYLQMHCLHRFVISPAQRHHLKKGVVLYAKGGSCLRKKGLVTGDSFLPLAWKSLLIPCFSGL